MTTKIITDSTCDLSPQAARELGVYIVPLSVEIDGETFLDSAEPSEFAEGKPMSHDEFLTRLQQASVFPKTSQPSPIAFQRAYEKALSDGATEAVCVTLSGSLSQTVNSARLGANEVEGKISVSVVDSKSASRGLAILVEHARKLAGDGKSGPEIAAAVQELVPHVHIAFTPDTLDYLKLGGRIGGAQALLGSALQIKPILGVDDNGAVEQRAKVRTRSKSLGALVDQITPQNSGEITVLSSGAADVDALIQKIKDRFGQGIQTNVSSIGPTIAAHVGPGALGVAFSDL